MLRNFIVLATFMVGVFTVFNPNKAHANLSKRDIDALFSSKALNPAKEVDGYAERVKNIGLQKHEFVIKTSFPIEKSATLPDYINLSGYDSAIKSQWNGTCTAFGMMAVWEAFLCVKGHCKLDLSERHFWSFYGQYSAETAIKQTGKYVGLEKDWAQTLEKAPSKIVGKYNVSGFKYGYNDKNLLMKVLSQNTPVYFWSLVPTEMAECRVSISKASFIDGGHAYEVIGYSDKKNPILIVKNSWGSGCGYKGYQYLKLSALEGSYWNFAYPTKINLTK